MRDAFLAAAIAGAALCACGKPDPEEDPKGPVFRITADYDPSLFAFEVHSDFKTLTDDPACRSLTAASSKPSPRTKGFTRPLPAGSLAVAVPLALSQSGPCVWEPQSVWFSQDGPECVGIPQINFAPPGAESTGEAAPPAPDTLSYLCRTDPDNGCLECKDESGQAAVDFRLDPAAGDALHFRVRKE